MQVSHFFSKMAYQPTCLHDFAFHPRWLSRFLLFQAYTMPTQSLHDAYISLHDFEALQRADENQLAHLQVFCFLQERADENQLAHLQVFCFLQAKKFSREFCSIQVE